MQRVLTYYDKRLAEKLRALRHLPPGHEFPPLANQEDYQLFQSVLNLSDNVDIFTWLEEYEQIGQVAVRIAIQEIGTLYLHLNTAKKYTSIPDHYKQILGGLLEYLEEDFPFNAKGNGEEFYDRSEVRKVLLSLQSSCQRSSFIQTAFHESDEREQFLAALLRLPATTDPFMWTMENHRNVAIQLILSHLLHDCTINRSSFMASPTLRTIQIKERFVFSAVEITIDKLLLKAEGFLMQAYVNMSLQKLRHGQDSIPSSYEWKGFDRAVDSSGYHYLTWAEKISSGSSHFHTYREDIVQAFYPAIVLDTLSITFFSQPVVIEPYNISKEGKRTHLPDIVLKDLTWHYDFPK
jgi:hypothetical protein